MKTVVYVVRSENGVETRRTDKKVAEEDAGLIRTVLHRACQVVEEVRDESAAIRGISKS